MKHNKIISVAIALCVTAFFTIGSLPSVSASTPTPVTITGVYDFTNFPNTTGTFTASGALGNLSGTSTMHVDLNPVTGIRAHCVVTLFPSTGGSIIIDQQCQFATSMPAPYPTGQGKGRWEIVGGTGAYANLNGNGSLTMPTTTGFYNMEEAMTGVIYQ